MAVTHASQIETAISRLRETAYNTPRTNADDFRRIISETRNVATEGLAFEDDAGYENGSDLAVDTWATVAETALDINPKLNFQDIGYQLDRALGGYAVSGPDGSLYTHTFTPQSMNTSRQLPSSTFLKKYGGLRLMLYPGMVCTQFTISGGRQGRLSTAQSFVGSGDREKNPSGYTSPSIVSDREYAYAGQATIRMSESGVGTRQGETVTAAGTASATNTANAIVTASGLTGSPITVPFSVTNGDLPAVWAATARTALRANAVIRSFMEVTGSGTSIIGTKWQKEANDATFNIEIAPGLTGITAVASSTNTTAGVAGSSQNYSCDLESWSLTLDNPTADDGYRQCSPYIVDGIPESGQMRSEYLVGARSYSFTFSARDNGTDLTEDWLRAGTIVDLEIPIVGKESNDFSLRITHTRARVVQAQPITNAGGDFIGVNGSIRLLAAAAGDGSIPLTFVLTNNVASYAS
jgi:hypothetical protein